MIASQKCARMILLNVFHRIVCSSNQFVESMCCSSAKRLFVFLSFIYPLPQSVRYDPHIIFVFREAVFLLIKYLTIVGNNDIMIVSDSDLPGGRKPSGIEPEANIISQSKFCSCDFFFSLLTFFKIFLNIFIYLTCKIIGFAESSAGKKKCRIASWKS